MTTNLIVFTQKCVVSANKTVMRLPLTAEQRQRAKQRVELETGEVVHLHLARGQKLHQQDFLQTADGATIAQVIAAPEAVITVRSLSAHKLLQAAYHLGNRHVPLEITPEYLRFSPDHVLVEMLQHLGVETSEAFAPFFPEDGAYHHH